MELLYLIYKKLSVGDINYAILLINYIICAISGFSIVFFNSFFGFSYLRDKFHLYLGILLPIVGYTITLIIGSNIALSLGMIGALSIIKFRTPVRSSYELVIYFLLLTVGITASVDIGVTIILTITSILVLLFLSVRLGINLSKYVKSNNSIEKIVLSFTLVKKDQNIDDLISDNKGINISVKKDKDKEHFLINGSIEFLNKKDLNVFLKNNENKIISYEIYKN